ncbi:hypothetical protein [Pontibacter sp. G13]|uniref:hypothetical protein n=1 Tax=Pontibacter sp. G13 TaxID=3074898 RepID=UPI00288A41E2|nr:hypothetical protein [Pontibacter sp. G13]WNJ15951.1 hypothetical protein RJD25_13900 [Pontibacter sp. G13]
MGNIQKLLIVGIFSSVVFTAYAGSTRGWGIRDIKDPTTVQEIRKQCPDYSRTRDGVCLGQTFRSYYLVRGVRGGGFGSGK